MKQWRQGRSTEALDVWNMAHTTGNVGALVILSSETVELRASMRPECKWYFRCIKIGFKKGSDVLTASWTVLCLVCLTKSAHAMAP